MKTYLFRVFALFSLVTCVQFLSFTAEARHHKDRHRRHGQLLMQLKADVTPEQKSQFETLANQLGLSTRKPILGGRVLAVSIGRPEMVGHEEDVADALVQTGAIEFAEPDYVVYPSAFVPNDPNFQDQWHHTAIKSSDAWGFKTGNSSVKVAVCDAGFAINHPDLAANFLPGYNLASDSTVITNPNDHGTYTAGAIGAIGNNGLGVAGMIWSVGIIPLQVSNQSDGTSDYSTLAECIHMAADKGAKVVNVSYAGMYDAASFKEAASYMRSKGGLVVGSAANDGVDLSEYENDPNVLIVGATDKNNQLATFSNFGRPVDLVAPGVAILTTVDPNMWGFAFGSVDGTSLSAPLVTGVAALIYAINPNFSAQQVSDFILSTAKDLGTAGVDSKFGAGLLDAGAAVRKAAVYADSTPPSLQITNPADKSTVSGLINVNAIAADNVSLKAVTFYVDGVSMTVDTDAPYSYPLNTVPLINGTHSLAATALDEKGLSRSATIQVTVNNPNSTATITVDNMAPKLSDSSRTFTGSWCTAANAGSMGVWSIYSCGSGVDTYRLTPTIPFPKSYDVFIRYTADSTRSTTGQVVVKSATGLTTTSINMQVNGNTWVKVGRFHMDAGTLGYLEVNDSKGRVVIDGAQFVPVNEVVPPAITLDNMAPKQSDSSRTFTGSWCTAATAGSMGVWSIYSCGSGVDTYRLTPTVPATRYYDVYIRYTVGSDRSAAAQVVVKHASGTASVSVNMQTNGGNWVKLGRYNLSAGTSNYLEVNDSQGRVNIDGAQFVPVP